MVLCGTEVHKVTVRKFGESVLHGSSGSVGIEFGGSVNLCCTEGRKGSKVGRVGGSHGQDRASVGSRSRLDVGPVITKTMMFASKQQYAQYCSNDKPN